MKKLIALLLALVMCLSLCACSRKTDRDKLSKQATFVQLSDMYNAFNKNQASAKEEYCDKTLRIGNCYVVEVHTDYVELRSDLYQNDEFALRAYLPTEELVNLESGQLITIIGQSAEDFEENNTDSRAYLVISNAYLSAIPPELIGATGYLYNPSSQTYVSDIGNCESREGKWFTELDAVSAKSEAMKLTVQFADDYSAVIQTEDGRYLTFEEFGASFSETLTDEAKFMIQKVDGGYLIASYTYKYNDEMQCLCYWDGGFYDGYHSYSLDTNQLAQYLFQFHVA